MSDPITWQQVAEILHHPEPESDAARQLVRRMVSRGMPCVPGRAGGLFFSDQVVDWLRREAEANAGDPRAEAPAPGRRSARRRRPAPAQPSPIRQRVRELRARPEGER